MHPSPPHLERCNCAYCCKIPDSDRCDYCGNWTVEPIVEQRSIRCRTCDGILRSRNVPRRGNPCPIRRRWDDSALRAQERAEQ